MQYEILECALVLLDPMHPSSSAAVLIVWSLAMSQSIRDYFPVKTDLVSCSLDRTRRTSSQVYMYVLLKKFQRKNILVGRVALRKFFNMKTFITKV